MMNTNAVIQSAITAAAAVKRSDDIVGADGVPRCSKCGGPHIVLYEQAGRVFRLPCICPCEEEADRAAEEELRKLRHITELEARRGACVPPALRSARFENAEPSPAVDLARRYADAWPEMLAANQGFILCGPPGTGKTYAAACIANELINKGVPVLVTSFPDILVAMAGLFGHERETFLDDLAGYDLLIIDDLGVERKTEYALEVVYSVIDRRYLSGRPLIVTTNLAKEEIEKPKDAAAHRIYSRVLEMCIPVQVTGADRRIGKAAEKTAAARKILFGR